MPVFGGGISQSILGVASGIGNLIALRGQRRLQKSAIDIGIRIANANAKSVIKAGYHNASNYLRRAERIKKRTRAAYGSSGVDVNTGSARAVQEAQEEEALRGALQINLNASARAYGIRTGTIGARTSYDIGRGQERRIGGEIAGSILGAGIRNLSTGTSGGNQFRTITSGTIPGR